MKYLTSLICFVCAFSLLYATPEPPTSLKADFILGNPEVQSMNALAFGPEGILFVGDAQSAAVVAIDMEGKAMKMSATEEINISEVDKKIADMLGTTPDNITITDMAVDPQSQQIYFAVHHGNGTPMLLRVDGGKFVPVSLDKVKYMKTSLQNAVAADAKDNRGRDLRKWAISDLNYADGKVMITGLSNKEFGSTFRTINFPFNEKQDYSSLEIYHAAHGKYETQSPVKTFLPLTLNGKPHMVAGYTCTPLVVFPMSAMKSGEHTKGKTVAELGNWNTPLDIIEMEKEGNRYLLLANSSRAVMKIKVSDIENFNDYLTTPVEERSATAGVDFIALPFVNVLQLDKLSDDQFVMLQREANGDLVLKTQSARWL